MNGLRPLIAPCIDAINAFNGLIGRAAKWLVLAMVLVQFLVVVMRYSFGIGSVQLQEAIIYMHGTLFLMVAADALRANAHVRVDIFYANLAPAKQRLIDALGAGLFILPLSALIVTVGWDYIAISWSVREGSRETSGLGGVYLFKTVILVFAIQLALQALAVIGEHVLGRTHEENPEALSL